MPVIPAFSVVSILSLWLAAPVLSQSQPVSERVPLKYHVEHQHTTGSCKGELTIDKWQFSYLSEDRPQDSRTWKLTDLRDVESKTPTELVLKTRESGAKTLGQERNYKFKLLGAGIERDVVEYMRDRVK